MGRGKAVWCLLGLERGWGSCGRRGAYRERMMEDSKGPRDGVGEKRGKGGTPEKDGKICRESGLGVMGALGFKNRRCLWFFKGIAWMGLIPDIRQNHQDVRPARA